MKRLLLKSSIDFRLFGIVGTLLVLFACGGDGTAPDTTRPVVSIVSPANGARNVQATLTVSVTFNEAMDSSTINATTFMVTAGGTQVAGAISAAGTIYTFTPSASLAVFTLYTVTVTTGATDVAGNAMAANFTSTFDTTRPVYDILIVSENSVFSGPLGFHIYTLDPASQQRELLMSLPGIQRSPAWSPDGTRVAFVSDHNRIQKLYIREPDGQIIQVTQGNLADYSPTWSPDGAYLAFAREACSPSCDRWDVFVVNTNGSEGRNLTALLPFFPSYPGDTPTPVWSPDGRYIAFKNAAETLLISPTDGAVTNLSTAAGGGASGTLAWAPSSAALAFTVSTDAFSGRRDLKITDLVSVRKVDSPFNPQGSIAWSPNGQQIAIAHGSDEWLCRFEPSDLIAVNVDGSGSSVLSSHVACDDIGGPQAWRNSPAP